MQYSQVAYSPVSSSGFCLDYKDGSDGDSRNAHSYSGDLTLDQQGFPIPLTRSHDPLQLMSDEIIVQDKGKYGRKHAWFFLVLGNNVSDHTYKPITVERLEKELDPTGEKGSVYCRRQLWKSVPYRYWNQRNQHTQPGLTHNENRKMQILLSFEMMLAHSY
jgi:hypothetical protein